jgi:hypothetical protein
MGKARGKEKVKWGPKDCLTRMLYKVSSQKVISFAFAFGAILLILVAFKKVITSEVIIVAIKAVRDIAITLLAVRGVQSGASFFADKIGGPKRVPDDSGKGVE